MEIQQTLYQVTLEQMHEGLQILDRNWKYLYLNKAACLHGQKESKELLNHKITDVYPGIEKTEMFHRLHQCMTEHISMQMENEFEYANGTKRWFELFIEPHSEGILIRSVDITDKKKMQEELWHTQKLESIGRLAGNLAHDLHNKFHIMLLNCENILDPNSHIPIKNSALSLKKALNHCSRLTRQLLAFSRKQILDLKVVNINNLLREYESSLPQLMGDDIQVQFHFAKQVQNIRLDPTQFDQVMLNLCSNARDAMPDGGTLTVETSMRELDTSYTTRHPEVIPGMHVLLSISDNGAGIQKDNMNKIYDPFFTTKPRQKGTGLGLSSVHGIIKQCGGHIWVYSEPSKGTTFKIYFPVTLENENLDAPNSANEKEQTVGGKETVLLLEDDPDLLEIFAVILENAGYKVFQATHPSQALNIFSNKENKIDILVTDIALPETTGLSVAQQVKKSQPTLKVIFLSGYTENTIVHNSIIDENCILIQKPASTKILLNVIRGVLDEKITSGVF